MQPCHEELTKSRTSGTVPAWAMALPVIDVHPHLTTVPALFRTRNSTRRVVAGVDTIGSAVSVAGWDPGAVSPPTATVYAEPVACAGPTIAAMQSADVAAMDLVVSILTCMVGPSG
ncbi:hypothetical protein EFK50_02305 [Nocardioides marmoriginsengisoli]|uniref:Uncharacterized protein n=1 Tax=Nocardioides marmoriginsengisoli TaxID=661483 RepID=A0A3N0CPM4_9ACTN|nr:hypothetical protein EFK50_02305 [Nocardioides marmoriginsengisoli]